MIKPEFKGSRVVCSGQLGTLWAKVVVNGGPLPDDIEHLQENVGSGDPENLC